LKITQREIRLSAMQVLLLLIVLLTEDATKHPLFALSNAYESSET